MPPQVSFQERGSAYLHSTYTQIGMTKKRLAWILGKDDFQIYEVFHLFKKKEREDKGDFTQIYREQYENGAEI